MSRERWRIGGAALAAFGGALLCLGLDHYWQSKLPDVKVCCGYPPLQPSAFESWKGDLTLIALPFFLLAGLILFAGLRKVAAAIILIALVVLTTLEYRWDHTGTESANTGLVFVWSFTLGVPLCLVVFAIDARLKRRRPGRSVPTAGGEAPT